jgi:hypothetical protein
VHRDNPAHVRRSQEVAVGVGHRSPGPQKAHARDCEQCETKDRKIDRKGLELELRGPLDEWRCQRLLDIAERCPVHRTLESEVMMETSLVEIEERALATNRNAKEF